MAQHDYNIGDQNGFDFLLDLNNALSAIVTNNAGSSEPNTTFAHMLWFDTNNDLMKMRNEANSAWVIVAKKDGSGWTPYRQGTALGTASVQPDNRYAHRSNNLSDLGSAATARANLAVIEDSSDADFTNDPDAAARRGLVAAAIAAIPSPVKAWVNFNGTGAVAIRDSLNVSSITDNGAGDYTINFAAALANANYAVATASTGSSGDVLYIRGAATNFGAATLKSTTQLRVLSGVNGGSTGNGFDCEEANVIICGT